MVTIPTCIRAAPQDVCVKNTAQRLLLVDQNFMKNTSFCILKTPGILKSMKVFGVDIQRKKERERERERNKRKKQAGKGINLHLA